MKQRVITGLVLLLIFVPTLFLPAVGFKLFCGVGVGVLLYELIKVFSLDKQMSLISVFVITILTYVLYFLTVSHYDETVRFINLVSAQVGIVVVLLALSVFDKEFEAVDVMKGMLVVYYIGFGVASIAITFEIAAKILVYVMVVSFATDIFAYFTGYFFGKHKLIEHISPKKTVEGAIGGTLMAIVIGTVFAYIFNVVDPLYKFTQIPDVGLGSKTFELFLIALASLLISVLSQIGDLVASRIKRQYGAKDFGSIFPGHGGLLDRFDSVIFASLGLFTFIGILSQIAAMK